MIKRIIFDLDNTLIDMPDTVYDEFEKIINKFHLNITGKDLYDAIGTYETSGVHKYYDKEKIIDTINSILDLNIDEYFLDEFFKIYNKIITKVDDSTIETLKYLKSKYELVILTNWFTDSQKARLNEANILEYFDEVYGTDIVPMKPLKESFLSVIGDLSLEECVMIGDNINIDIKVPSELGMKVYHLNKKDKTNYPTINKISDLKEML